MPQMAPLYWVMLFIMFLTLFIFSSIKIYFSSNSLNSSKTPDSNFNNNIMLLSWKW